MAKRTPPRAEAADATATPAPPKPRRMRGPAEKRDAASGPRPDAVDAGETSASAGTPAGTMASDLSASSVSSPSEEDIRTRAYHRYLERGGGNGMDFEDWLEAERELKSQRAQPTTQK
jgi:hypothetical protein